MLQFLKNTSLIALGYAVILFLLSIISRTPVVVLGLRVVSVVFLGIFVIKIYKKHRSSPDYLTGNKTIQSIVTFKDKNGNIKTEYKIHKG